MRVLHQVDSIVFAPPFRSGGVKSLYLVCEALNELGRSRIAPFPERKLASWFSHSCDLYDNSYSPEVVVYPEVFQPYLRKVKSRICFALGKYSPIKPYADLTVCKSSEILSWVKQQHPDMPTVLIAPSIDRAVFAYDERPKKDLICYMTRPHKHPEIAPLLRQRYGTMVVEIINRSESEVAEILKAAKVFVWCGNEQEGSPRPPKEALVAGCVVVGLASDLHERYATNFGIPCASVSELVEMAGKALRMPIPTPEQRSVVRDSKSEKQEWRDLVKQISFSLLLP